MLWFNKKGETLSDPTNTNRSRETKNRQEKKRKEMKRKEKKTMASQEEPIPEDRLFTGPGPGLNLTAAEMAEPFYHIDDSDAAGTRDERQPIGRGKREGRRKAHIAPMETVNRTGKTV